MNYIIGMIIDAIGIFYIYRLRQIFSGVDLYGSLEFIYYLLLVLLVMGMGLAIFFKRWWLIFSGLVAWFIFLLYMFWIKY